MARVGTHAIDNPSRTRANNPALSRKTAIIPLAANGTPGTAEDLMAEFETQYEAEYSLDWHLVAGSLTGFMLCPASGNTMIIRDSDGFGAGDTGKGINITDSGMYFPLVNWPESTLMYESAAEAYAMLFFDAL